MATTFSIVSFWHDELHIFDILSEPARSNTDHSVLWNIFRCDISAVPADRDLILMQQQHQLASGSNLVYTLFSNWSTAPPGRRRERNAASRANLHHVCSSPSIGKLWISPPIFCLSSLLGPKLIQEGRIKAPFELNLISVFRLLPLFWRSDIQVYLMVLYLSLNCPLPQKRCAVASIQRLRLSRICFNYCLKSSSHPLFASCVPERLSCSFSYRTYDLPHTLRLPLPQYITGPLRARIRHRGLINHLSTFPYPTRSLANKPRCVSKACHPCRLHFLIGHPENSRDNNHKGSKNNVPPTHSLAAASTRWSKKQEQQPQRQQK